MAQPSATGVHSRVALMFVMAPCCADYLDAPLPPPYADVLRVAHMLMAGLLVDDLGRERHGGLV